MTFLSARARVGGGARYEQKYVSLNLLRLQCRKILLLIQISVILGVVWFSLVTCICILEYLCVASSLPNHPVVDGLDVRYSPLSSQRRSSLSEISLPNSGYPG